MVSEAEKEEVVEQDEAITATTRQLQTVTQLRKALQDTS